MTVYQKTVKKTPQSKQQFNLAFTDSLYLENGDRLTQPEFERRYRMMPHLKKAELIEGIVYIFPSVRHCSHGKPCALMVGWLGSYCAATPNIDFSDNATIRLDIDNEPQPDALLRLHPEHGGKSRLSKDDYIEGPPELIIEIAASSASYDLHDKKNVYRCSGVQEYIVWRVYDQSLDWFSLQQGQYHPLPTDENDIIQSKIFPGLHLPVTALLKGDLATVINTVTQATQTPTHQAFVAKLTTAK